MTDGAAVATRSSTRVRNKSARALESEHTDKLLAAAKGRTTRSGRAEEAKEEAEGEAAGAGGDDDTAMSEAVEDQAQGEEKEKAEEDVAEHEAAESPTKGKKRAAAPKSRAKQAKKPRRSKYCTCHEDRKGPMIECGECVDWFHFDCIDLPEDEAERIHKYVCPACSERTGEKTTYIYDIKSFPSPAPPSDVEIEDADAEAKPKKRTSKRAAAAKSKRKAAEVEEPEAPAEPEAPKESDAAQESEAPIAPEAPAEPEAPTEPEALDAPEAAKEPEAPTDLPAPTETETVAQSEAPKEPAEETEPAKEAEPTVEAAPESAHSHSPSPSAHSDSGSEAVPSEPESASEPEPESPRKRTRRESKHVASPSKNDGGRGKRASVSAPGRATRAREAKRKPSIAIPEQADSSKQAETLGQAKDVAGKAEGAPVKQRRESKQGKHDPPATPATPVTPVTPVTPTVTTAGSAHGLPPVRKFVLDKMAALFRDVFGDKKDTEAVDAYSREVEAGIYAKFKEVVKGKEAAAGRYKAQYNLLHSSLSRASERPELVASIADGTLSAAQVALLTSTDVATDEQRAEIEAAQKESLRQTVKVREEGVQEIRAGRDGYEIIEPERRHEDERDGRDGDRNEGGDDEADHDAASPANRARRESDASASIPPPSPTISIDSGHRPSITPLSPIARGRQLSSAWRTEAAAEEATLENLDTEQDQDAVDLSDIVAEADVEYDGLGDEKEGGKAVVEDALKERPVLWSGSITNPAVPSPSVPIDLRLISGRTTPPAAYWSRLLPSRTIAIAGRVPVAQSLQYLADRRLDRTRELVTVVFSPAPSASEVERRSWNDLVEFHVQRERHGIYHPYTDRLPAGAARELYLIPLRPGDASPEIFDLVDNYSLPAVRSEPVVVGIFVANREGGSNSPAEQIGGPSPTSRSPYAHAPSHSPHSPHPHAPPRPPPVHHHQPQPTHHQHQPPGPSAPAPGGPLPNLQLQALVASLNPAAIAGVMNQSPNNANPMSPLGPAMSPPQGVLSPNPHSNHHPGPGPGQMGPPGMPGMPPRPPFPPYRPHPQDAYRPPPPHEYYPPPQHGAPYDPRAQGFGPPGFQGGPRGPPGPPGPPRPGPVPGPGRGGFVGGFRGRGRGRGRGRW